MSEETKPWKKIILEVLDFIRYKVENDRLTMSDAESIARTISSNLELEGTIEDLASFYKVQESRVRNTINRKMIQKPKRRVYYRFLSFMKIAPEKWRNEQFHK